MPSEHHASIRARVDGPGANLEVTPQQEAVDARGQQQHKEVKKVASFNISC